MKLYKFFTQKDHMDAFLSGRIRFRSILYYKRLKSKYESKISDKLEGEVFTSLDPSKYTIKIDDHTIESTDFAASINITRGEEDTSDHLIFCSTTSPEFEEKDYKYCVKFCLDEFNNALTDFFSRAHEYYKKREMSGEWAPLGKTSRAMHLSFNQCLNHKIISYYSKENHSSLKLDPLFSKENNYSEQREYRHAFFIDYYQFFKENHRIHIKEIKAKQESDKEILKELIITLDIGKINSEQVII